MLKSLGYKQELQRGMSLFANFAISFSIITVLAGITGAASEQNRNSQGQPALLAGLAGFLPLLAGASP